MHDPTVAATPLRSLDEISRELAELRATSGSRIDPAEFDRYRARARQLRAEAMRHLVDTAVAAARSRAAHVFERDAAADCTGAAPRST